MNPSSVTGICNFRIHNTNCRGSKRKNQGALYAEMSAFLRASNENRGTLCGNFVSILSWTSWPWPDLTLICQTHWLLLSSPMLDSNVKPTDRHGHGQVRFLFRPGMSSAACGSETNFSLISREQACISWVPEMRSPSTVVGPPHSEASSCRFYSEEGNS